MELHNIKIKLSTFFLTFGNDGLLNICNWFKKDERK
jgi:hypothetical protein